MRVDNFFTHSLLNPPSSIVHPSILQPSHPPLKGWINDLTPPLGMGEK